MLTKPYYQQYQIQFVFQIVNISFKKRKCSLLILNENPCFKYPPFLSNLGVLYQLSSSLYHYFVTVKSCFLLGTGETLAWTTASSFLWKTLTNQQTNKQQTNKQTVAGIQNRTNQKAKSFRKHYVVLYSYIIHIYYIYITYIIHIL